MKRTGKAKEERIQVRISETVKAKAVEKLKAKGQTISEVVLKAIDKVIQE